MDKHTEPQIYIDQIRQLTCEIEMLKEDIKVLREDKARYYKEMTEERSLRFKYHNAFSALVEEIRKKLS